MKIQAIELDPTKVYSIAVEVGNFTYSQAVEHLQDVKSMYEKYGIKAVYTAMSQGVPNVTINEILPSIKRWDEVDC